MLFALTTCALLPGCMTLTASGETECARWTPIYWSKLDTTDTVSQVKEHNAAWKRVCGDGR
jgi:hypothetical protein